MKEKLIALYHEMKEDPTIKPYVIVELRAFLNRHFKAQIKPGALGGPRLAAMPQVGNMTNRWTPSAKKKLSEVEGAAANRERYKVQTRQGITPPPVQEVAVKEVSEDQKIKQLRAEIDALGGRYHHKAGAGALEKILEKLKADQAETHSE